MRDLGKSETNKLVIYDARSGSEIVFFYRQPTTSEQVAYQAKLYKRQGKKLLVNYNVRLEMGLEIMTGFGEGAFCLEGKQISSDQQSSYYFADWKRLLREMAADLLMLFSAAVFEGSRAKIKDEEDDIEIAALEVENDLPPLS